jgi:hypothetical protein
MTDTYNGSPTERLDENWTTVASGSLYRLIILFVYHLTLQYSSRPTSYSSFRHLNNNHDARGEDRGDDKDHTHGRPRSQGL